ncbi:Rab GTPase interacting factor, Golgi membrane protein [Phaffia rhodozyma]|uniref:Protein YIP n=1 Tax=Phaffia rhodozyma TaxID=264483 RepID=A0A0F7SVQ2_PHARH|nr:Rab GTPase interacting factor, Golgi membrane protein [Phaffia rhodozyma]
MFSNSPYQSQQGYPSSPYGQQAQPDPLAFYSSQSIPAGSDSTGYMGYGSGVAGNMGGGIEAISGRMDSGPMGMQRMSGEGRWWEAFGTCGFEGEPPLMEELGINPSHILTKSLTVLNPLSKPDEQIMDDADLAGPLLFCFGFAMVLLFSGKPQFSYIYAIALMGTIAIYTLLNMMAQRGIDAYRTASVLGYCLLPMVGLGTIGMGVGMDRPLGYALSFLSVLWCTHSASSIFVAVLRMSDQRLLVAYPIMLLYGCFALFSVFTVGVPGSK